MFVVIFWIIKTEIKKLSAVLFPTSNYVFSRGHYVIVVRTCAVKCTRPRGVM